MRMLLLPLLLAAACSRSVSVADETAAILADAHGVTLARNAPQWHYVELGVAAAQDPLPPLPAPGRVELDPKRTAAVGVPLPGRVESVLVRLGAKVERGDRLFSVRSAAFAELDREVAVARAQLALRQRSAQRVRTLFERKAAAQKDVLVAEAELQEAELVCKAAESKQRSLAVAPDGDNLFWVCAARAGAVVEVDLFPGQEVGPERDRPLLRLSDLDEVLVVADVSEGDVRDVAMGQQVGIRSRCGECEHLGMVEWVSEFVEPRRRTVEVWVRVPNRERHLRPNGFVEVTFAAAAGEPVVAVPDAAVVTQGTQTVVFVATSADRLEPRPVHAGRRRDGRVEIRHGLEPGTSYVARGALLLLNAVDLAADS
ncbi:MAG: efflux RND transporter periplasmic adaptor subunit [Planctomycetes bacterium]|nr:efflux RND transporter periplasmic adaptor subunit [Planctomycetota bacterium]